MRVASIACVAVVAACGGGSSTYHAPAPGDQGDQARAIMADDDGFRPSYSRQELERALIAERGKEATAEQQVAALEAKQETDPSALDRWRIAAADLDVRRRFIASLELCQASARGCPARLDEPAWTWDRDADPGTGHPPPLESTMRFDLGDWRALALELRGRACACRTVACLDDLDVAISDLETKPTPEVESDDAAAGSITAARECLFRLRGKAVAKVTVPTDDQ